MAAEVCRRDMLTPPVDPPGPLMLLFGRSLSAKDHEIAMRRSGLIAPVCFPRLACGEEKF